MSVIAVLLQLPALLEPSAGQAPLLALAALTVAALLAVAVTAGAGRFGPPPAARAHTALRARSARTAFLRLRDPAAPGRPLPRAPSA
ncbi:MULTISPECIES: DUF6412 domain-containing protein [Thermomonospora]|uniref:Uncharacterized protein n=1 Tax=Thermomonospora curvata (strain ATCC 19995 / DSM 43183 / JCM 3096 / KCTC 9072 / NBRC 15933 / NCIMB 10081 / Henssen B9) TaxID=471852 RepID=D1AC12_THECD|nr:MULTISPECIES: DUF6412 domain-containing protein [Thermomonospora]ACY97278.1 hypothetical protein Tcur_1704 [Thermomonospora curvata DSM 43183]PKK14648.1 MAG: hypothetical protein BUE48_008370 [Thermomonospora sp. CIF 1]